MIKETSNFESSKLRLFAMDCLVKFLLGSDTDHHFQKQKVLSQNNTFFFKKKKSNLIRF